jgi:hypothetical protein
MSTIPRRTYLSTCPYVPFDVRNLMVVPKEPRNSSWSSTKISKILLGRIVPNRLLIIFVVVEPHKQNS